VNIKVLEQLKAIYGELCIICQTNLATELYFIIPQANLKHARKLNKRGNRSKRIMRPVIANNSPDNLLPVCQSCKIKDQRSVYLSISQGDRMRIDALRAQHKFTLINSCSCQRELHRLISNNQKEDSKC
jgi:hypothetical protein